MAPAQHSAMILGFLGTFFPINPNYFFNEELGRKRMFHIHVRA